jgi:hypothetical protein
MTPSSGTTVQAGDGIATPSGHEPDVRGHFGRYGGRFVPEALVAALDERAATYEKARHDDEFLGELNRLQRDYTGRPSPLTDATRGIGDSDSGSSRDLPSFMISRIASLLYASTLPASVAIASRARIRCADEYVLNRLSWIGLILPSMTPGGSAA